MTEVMNSVTQLRSVWIFILLIFIFIFQTYAKHCDDISLQNNFEVSLPKTNCLNISFESFDQNVTNVRMTIKTSGCHGIELNISYYANGNNIKRLIKKHSGNVLLKRKLFLDLNHGVCNTDFSLK